jgi:hypothetical protein
MGRILVTCVLALVFGFGGAVVAVAVLQDQLQGAAGPTGVAGAAGPAGPAGRNGVDGVNGKDGTPGTPGARGPRGLPGAPGKPAPSVPPAATDLGTEGCAGRSVSVITGVGIIATRQLKVNRQQVCILGPSSP